MSLGELTNQSKNQNQSLAEPQKKSHEIKEEFFAKIAQEVKILHKTVDDENMARLLNMTPKYALNTFIPDQLRSLDIIRANQERQIEDIRSFNQELQGLLDISNLAIDELGFKNEYSYKLRAALSNQITNRRKTHQLLDQLADNATSCQVENERFNKITNEIHNLVCILFGIIKLKNLIRYSIKRANGRFVRIDLYRWVKEEDVRQYNAPRWHYIIDFLEKTIYVRRYDDLAVFIGTFDDFDANLNKVR